MPLLRLIYVYDNNYNNNYYFVILTQLTNFLQATLVLYAAPQLRCSNMQLHTRLINYNWLLRALSGLFIYACLQSAERSLSRRFIISPSRELYRESLCMSILRLVWPACLLLSVYLVGIQCVCVHTKLLFCLRFLSLSCSWFLLL